MASADALRSGLRLDAPGRAETVTGDGFSCALASADDDAEIRRLLRDQSMPGEIRMSFEREPDTSFAAAIEGDVHQALIARDRVTGRIVATAARSVREAFVNGASTRLGYLGQLRIDRSCRRVREVLTGGFDLCRRLHDEGDARVYLASLGADHGVARRLLVGDDAGGNFPDAPKLPPASSAAPAFVPVDDLTTFAIHVRFVGGRVFRPGGFDTVRIEAGSPSHLPAITACLQRNLSRFQFAPRWTEDDLRSATRTRGLAPEDFAVALRGDRVIGCAAIWDQREFKQVRIRGYSPRLARLRPLVNLASRVLRTSGLPAVGDTLRSAYLSHVAVDDDRTDVFAALLTTLRRRAAGRGLDFLVTGFTARHPFHGLAASQRHHAYRTTLYAGCWPDGEALVRALDGRVSQPEVAVL